MTLVVPRECCGITFYSKVLGSNTASCTTREPIEEGSTPATCTDREQMEERTTVANCSFSSILLESFEQFCLSLHRNLMVMKKEILGEKISV